MRNIGLAFALLTLSACTPALHHVEFLADAQCGRTPVSLTNLEMIHITGSCIDEGAVTALHLAVRNLAPSGYGNLQAFSLEFCGNAIKVDTPESWVSRVDGRPDIAINFQIRDEGAHSFSIPPNGALDGFVVRLSRDWRRKATVGARWDNGGVENVMTHDQCQ